MTEQTTNHDDAADLPPEDTTPEDVVLEEQTSDEPAQDEGADELVEQDAKADSGTEDQPSLDEALEPAATDEALDEAVAESTETSEPSTDEPAEDEAADELASLAADGTVPNVTVVSRFISNVLGVVHPEGREDEVTSKQVDAYRAHLGYVYSVTALTAEASVQHLDLLPKDAQEAVYLGAIKDLPSEE